MTSVLVIDDSETTQNFLKKVLDEEDYSVTTVEKFSEAEGKLDSTDFDLIFLDCWLPDVEGLSAVESIRDYHEGPIVMVSGYADRSIVEEAHSLGVRHFLEKPLDPDIIRRVTRKALNDESPASEDEELPEEIEFYMQPKVLVVEDDDSVRDLLTHPFDHYEIPYRFADDGDEAWEIFRDFKPDVVILDALLPEGGMSSTDFFDRARSHRDDCFFIGITGYPDSDEVNYLISQDISEYFYKPFSVTELLKSLSHLSFVIQKRSESDQSPDIPVEDSSAEPRRFRRKVVIGLLAILIGLLLGFFVKWTRQLTQNNTGRDLTIEKMFRKIDGYLERDEQRERRER